MAQDERGPFHGCLIRHNNKSIHLRLPPRIAALEKRNIQVQKEKELIEKKMQRIEKSKETEVAELKDKLVASQGDVRAQLKVKDDKITEV